MTASQMLMETDPVVHWELMSRSAVRVMWFHGSLFFCFLWYFFMFKINSAGTSLVEDTCQCLEAKYSMMCKLFKAKESSVKTYFLLITWRNTVIMIDHWIRNYCFCLNRIWRKLFWRCMITLLLRTRICFCCRYCCASVWAFVMIKRRKLLIESKLHKYT